MWTDGSAADGVADGGAGALIIWPNGEEDEIRTPAGRLSSSYRAEMVVLQSALAQLLESTSLDDDPIVVCTDSQSALASLRDGLAAQTTPMGISIWRSLSRLAEGGRLVHLQWVPSHCGIDGDERADAIVKEASSLYQSDAAADVRTVHRAAARLARARTVQAWSAVWYRQLMGSRLPRPVARGDKRSGSARPPAESWPLDQLNPVETQGRTGPLQNLRAVRE